MGFIGSSLIKKINDEGYDDILIVEKSENEKKKKNLENLKYKDLIFVDEFLKKRNFFSKFYIEKIFHQGAITNTKEKNTDLLDYYNFEFSKSLYDFALKNNSLLVYASSASVYGNRQNNFIEFPKFENPLNEYGKSKLKFDNFIRSQNEAIAIGLRYFNVYGSNEKHKIGMSSAIFNFILSSIQTKKIFIFKGNNGFMDGEHRRDFIYVNDVIDIILRSSKLNLTSNYICNCGSGKSISFNQIADIIKKFLIIDVEYIDFPDELKNIYQPFTESNNENLIKLIGDFKFTEHLAAIKGIFNHLKING